MTPALWAGEDQRQAAAYRSDIDGLRAIAVISVVLFHLDFATFKGGFVGVDIFFVISGYLIGKSILDQRRSGTFTFLSFYQKRARRILPALVGVLTATTIAGFFILLPVAYEDYGWSLIAAVLSIGNVLFWLEAGYFDSASHAKPLLHTWSLGVEEQFYILLPIALWFTTRIKRFDLHLIAVIAFASLSASIWITNTNPSANFYLIPTRAWELLAGVLAAELRFKLMEKRPVREAVSWASLAILGLICLLYGPSMRFPGLAAIPPVLATAMLMNAGAHGKSFAFSMLSIRPVVFVGLLSYSLYLWHWPIIVLIKQWMPEAWLRMPHRVIALSLTLVFAWLSWRFVERPFRSRLVSNSSVWWFSGISGLLLIGAAGLIIMQQGMPNRFPPKVAQMASFLTPSEETDQTNPCQLALFAEPGSFVPESCLSRSSDRPNVLIIGDSHANHLRYGLEQSYPEIAFQQATAAGCRMTIQGAGQETPTCKAFREQLFDGHVRTNPPDWVVIGLFWGEDAFASLKPTVDFLHDNGVKIVIAGPVARYEMPLPQILAMGELRDDTQIASRLRIPGAAQADARFKQFADENGLEYMSTYQAMCPDGDCVLSFPDGEPIQTDSHHLGKQGSQLVATQFPAAKIMGAWRTQIGQQSSP